MLSHGGTHTLVTTNRVAPLIIRAYNESIALQWVRETFVNAAESGADQVHYLIEWQGVENRGVYRRMIADNGCGMDADELRLFFGTFGGGGKPIGAEHDNYGVGAKTSLMPWNRAGLIVISWKDGIGSMVHIEQDPVSGEFGMRRIDGEHDGDEIMLDVWDPDYFDDELGVDFSTIKPDFIEDNGTILLLCGNSLDQHTVLGDPVREEHRRGSISAYINMRVWDLDAPIGTSTEPCPAVYVEQFDRAHSWPTKRPDSTNSKANIGYRPRWMKGARYFVMEPVRTAKHTTHTGVLTMEDGTKIEWFLRDGALHDPGSWGAQSAKGFIAARYKNELFYGDATTPQRWRQFGIAESEVTARAWLIIEPPEFDGKHGVYNDGSRKNLVFVGARGPLPEPPVSQWADFFAANMPEEFVKAIRSVTPKPTRTHDELKRRLKERFGARWRLPDWMRHPKGKVYRREGGGTTEETTTVPPKRKPPKPPQGRERGPNVNERKDHVLATTHTATDTLVPGIEKKDQSYGVPEAEWVTEDRFTETWHFAMYVPESAAHPEGLVMLNQNHYVIVEQIAFHQARMIKQDEVTLEKVKQHVMDCYASSIVATVTHTESLMRVKGGPTREDVAQFIRSPEALTVALMGLYAQDQIIGPGLGGVAGKTRS